MKLLISELVFELIDIEIESLKKVGLDTHGLEFVKKELQNPRYYEEVELDENYEKLLKKIRRVYETDTN